jgi:hypothetical protein
MVDDDVLGRIFNATAAAWTFVLMTAVALFKAWPSIMGRFNERSRDVDSAKGRDWDRLRAEIVRLDERCDHLQTEVDACREREGVWMARAIAAEAYQLGKGQARQDAQVIVSTERQIDADKRDKK